MQEIVRQIERDLADLRVETAELRVSQEHLRADVMRLSEALGKATKQLEDISTALTQGRTAIGMLLGASSIIGALVATFVKPLVEAWGK